MSDGPVYECRLVRLVGGRDTTRGFAVVDAADWDDASQFQWRMHKNGYAIRAIGTRNELLHRRIMNCTEGDGIAVDHINGCKLDNRRANLRACTNAENSQNQRVRRMSGKTSRYRGVSREYHRWIATAIVAGKLHHLGRYDTEEEAATVASGFRREHMPFAVEDGLEKAAVVLPLEDLLKLIEFRDEQRAVKWARTREGRAFCLERMRWLGEIQ